MTLFTQNNVPLKFTMYPLTETDHKSEYIGAIFAHGGEYVPFDNLDDSTIVLSVRNFIEDAPKDLHIFDIRYIKYCIKEYKLLSLKSFLIRGGKKRKLDEEPQLCPIFADLIQTCDHSKLKIKSVEEINMGDQKEQDEERANAEEIFRLIGQPF